MKKNITKKRLIGQIVLTSIFSIIIIGTSLAIFFSQDNGKNNSINSKKLVNITYSNGSILRLTNNIPIYESDIESSATEFNFTVTNPNSSPVYASIDLTNISISNSLKIYDFKWALYEENTKLTTGTFVNADNKLNLYNNSVIGAGLSKNYKLRVWVNEIGKFQDISNTSFTATPLITAYSRILKTLSNKILESNNVITTGNGLYVQKEDNTKTEFGFPTYYYRGNVDNNYVQFGTYKSDITNEVMGTTKVVAHAGDPIIWRIVRINEDGSIRLISQNNISLKTIWSSNGIVDYTTSNIKTVVENWYNSTIGNNSYLDSKVETSNFCNDVSDNYAAYERLLNNDAIFKCPNSANIINSKVGLITSDELWKAGSGTDSYIYNETFYWTMTPRSSSEVFKYLLSGSKISSSAVNGDSNSEPRPVINLKPDVTISGGNGSKSSPYIIQ